MLMFTHTWLLKNYLGLSSVPEELLDLFVYNICPDFLPIVSEFNAAMTHSPSRFRPIPQNYRKASCIVFHLLVDDISHYGCIDEEPSTFFRQNANGYSYVRGRYLVDSIITLFEKAGKPLDHMRAAYRSHMIIEMTFDLSLYILLGEESKCLVKLMSDALQYTTTEKLQEFSEIVGWFYNTDPEIVGRATIMCAERYTLESLQRHLTLQGKMNLFAEKFELGSLNDTTYQGLRNIMLHGMDLVKDYGDFLRPTIETIRNSGLFSSY
ncbi:MAG: hypothetical protein N2317_07085 [Syntrophales bacterium]|nr:hypothetical protein [Syntrophales bacterium]